VEVTLSSKSSKTLYKTILLVVVVGPLIATLFAIRMLWMRAVNGTDISLLLSLYILVALGITVGYHRMLTHRSFQPHPVIKFIFLVLGSMALEGAASNKEVVVAMKSGAQALQKAAKDINIEKVDDVMEEIAESMQLADELNDALSQPIGQAMDEDELKADMDELEAELMDEELDSIPSVPTKVKAKDVEPEVVEVPKKAVVLAGGGGGGGSSSSSSGGGGASKSKSKEDQELESLALSLGI